MTPGTFLGLRRYCSWAPALAAHFKIHLQRGGSGLMEKSRVSAQETHNTSHPWLCPGLSFPPTARKQFSLPSVCQTRASSVVQLLPGYYLFQQQELLFA